MDRIIRIGRIIKGYRLNLGITLEKLADNLNAIYPDEKFTKGKISKWERDSETPKVTSLKRLTDYYGTTIDQILTDAQTDFDYEQRLKEAKYKEKLIDTLQNLNYEFDKDAFRLEEFIVDGLKVINTELDTTYEVDPRELYDEMKETFSNIVELQAQSNLQIEFDEVRKTFEKLNTANSIVEKPDLYKVNVTEKVAAGRGHSYGNNETTPHYTDRADLPPYDLATLVKGDSMEPKYKDGDVVLLRQGYDNVNGDVYVIDYDGKLYIKKLYNDGDRFRMVSINRKYDNIIIDIPPENGKYFNIIGKVIDSFTPVKL